MLIFPAEGQNLLDEVSGPLSSLMCLLQVALRQRALFNVIHRHFCKADDGKKDVVKIMGNTAS